MMSSNLTKACIIIALTVVLLFKDNFGPSDDYFIKEYGDVMQHEITNAGGHVYPYTASIVSVTCLLAIVMIIICFGANFSG